MCVSVSVCDLDGTCVSGEVITFDEKSDEGY